MSGQIELKIDKNMALAGAAAVAAVGIAYLLSTRTAAIGVRGPGAAKAADDAKAAIAAAHAKVAVDAKAAADAQAAANAKAAEAKPVRVALYPGHFDPITDASLVVAAELVNNKVVDEVVFVVRKTASPGAAYLQRLVMIHAAVESSFSWNYPVSVANSTLTEETDTFCDVLARYKNEHPGDVVSLVVGADQLQQPYFASVKDSKELSSTRVLVIPRVGITVDPHCLAPCPLISLGPPGTRELFIEEDNSPDNLRLRCEKGSFLSIEGLVPQVVVNYIMREGLYGGVSAVQKIVNEAKAQNRKPRMAVLGGSFSPATKSHFSLAAEILHSGQADRVVMVPCGNRPDKPSLDVPALDRFLMTEIGALGMYSSSFPLDVDPIEASLESAFKGTALLDEMRKKYPDFEVVMVYGADLFEALQTWGDGTYFPAAQFLIAPRPGSDLPSVLPSNCQLITPPKAIQRISAQLVASSLGMSSTTVRDRLKFSHAEGLVTPFVLSYGMRYGLYGTVRTRGLD